MTDDEGSVGPTLRGLEDLQKWYQGMTPSAPDWYRAIDHVVGVLLKMKIDEMQAQYDEDQNKTIGANGMAAASRIIDGLKDALRYARGDCRHEYTYWEPGNIMAGTGRLRAWKRTCTKCKIRVTRFSETEPEN